MWMKTKIVAIEKSSIFPFSIDCDDPNVEIEESFEKGKFTEAPTSYRWQHLMLK